MTKTYQIITDSSCDLPQSLVDQIDVRVMPLHVYIDGVHYYSYLDWHEIPPKAFFDRVRNGAKITTSAASLVENAEFLEPSLREGLDVIFISFSSGLTSNCHTMQLAAEELQEKYPERRILIMDSLCASLGQGLFVYLAAKKQQEGASLTELYDYLTELRLHVCHWFTLNDLMYLKRGGRISATAAIAGTMLQIKPVMHMDNDGRLAPVTKAKGRKAALTALAAKALETGIDLPSQTLFICHGDCREDAEFIAAKIREKSAVQDIIINYVGTGIGAHTGPGVVSLFFIGTQR